MAEGYSMMIGGDVPVVERLHPVLEVLAPDNNPDMVGIAPDVADSGEGCWAVAEAINLDVPAPVVTLLSIQRLRARHRAFFRQTAVRDAQRDR